MSIPVVTRMLAGALLVSCGLAVADERSGNAVYWLERMTGALQNQNYDGTFIYMRGSTFDTVRIVHVAEQGRETERLFNLNGEIRELFRDGDEIHCFHPRPRDESLDLLSDHTFYIGLFSSAFSDRVLSTQNQYRLSMQGEARIAGRKAVKLAISPRFNDRYGYRVWLDEKTGLLLQSHLIHRGRVKEIFQFTSVEIGEAVSAADLATAIDGETVSHELALDMSDLPDKPGWRVSWLPDGFRPVRARGNRLHFTDGLANFSVFVEKSGASPMPDLTTTVGGTVVITRRLKKAGSQITVVGEVPVQTARRVAESVEPVIY